MITYKHIEDKDRPFIEKVYRSTREEELLFTYWTEEQKNTFVLMQLNAQVADYKNNYKEATYELILYHKKPVGYLYLWETRNEIRILDISLLPEFRENGIGTFILKEIIASAGLKKKFISLHVAHNNPAKNLYKRLGFKVMSNCITHIYMEYKFEK